MNINDLFAVKTLNIEKAMEGVEYSTGTFKNILDKVYDGTISLLVNNRGDVVGGNYNSGKTGAEDSIEQMKFERAYCGKPLMTWVCKAVELKVQNKVVTDVIEDGNDVKIVVDGKVVVVSEESHYDDYDEDYEDYDDDELPEEISLDDLGLDEDATDRELRHAIKNFTGYFVAKDAELEIDYDEGVVTGIEYGRKASASELD